MFSEWAGDSIAPIVVGLVIGTLLSLVALVVADRRRWGGVWIEYSWGDSPEITESVGMKLRQLSLPVETTMYPDGRVRLRYRHRDGRRVAVALSRLGIPPARRVVNAFPALRKT